MIEIRNRTGRDLPIFGTIIPSHNTVKLDIPYTSVMKRLEDNGIISVLEVEDRPIIFNESITPVIKPRQKRQNRNKISKKES